MIACDFEPTETTDGNGRRKFRCARCGYVTVFIPDLGQSIIREQCDRQGGLGDTISRWLSYVGITQPRMVAVFGDCGCEERQQVLNQAGWELAGRWKAAADWLWKASEVQR